MTRRDGARGQGSPPFVFFPTKDMVQKEGLQVMSDQILNTLFIPGGVVVSASFTPERSSVEILGWAET